MTSFRITGMTCGGCAARIQKAILALDDQAQIEVNLTEKRVAITGTATEAQYAKAIERAGYAAEAIH